MVSALDRALRENLATRGCGIRASPCSIPRPAPAHFCSASPNACRNRKQHEGGGGMAALALQDLASRMFGFELLVGPYAVATIGFTTRCAALAAKRR